MVRIGYKRKRKETRLNAGTAGAVTSPNKQSGQEQKEQPAKAVCASPGSGQKLFAIKLPPSGPALTD